MNRFLFDTLVKVFRVKMIMSGAAVIITNSNGEILLGKRDMNSLFFPGFWGLPGGIPNFGEKLEDAAKRELMEEMGIEIKITKPGKRVYENIMKNIHSLGVIFHGKIIHGTPKACDETDEVRWFKPEEIRKMKLAYNHNEILQVEGLI